MKKEQRYILQCVAEGHRMPFLDTKDIPSAKKSVARRYRSRSAAQKDIIRIAQIHAHSFTSEPRISSDCHLEPRVI